MMTNFLYTKALRRSLDGSPKNGGTIVDEIGEVIGVCFPEMYCSEQHANMQKVVIFEMNGGGGGRNGLILWENDATGSRKVFKYIPDLWEAIKIQK